MKWVLALTMAFVLSGCASSGDDFVQEGLPNTNPNTGQTQTPPPDPVVTDLIDSRYVGNIKLAASGGGQNFTFDFDSVLEYREKQAGKLIGYSRMWDKLQDGKLIIDYWSDGQRTNADMTLSVQFNPACPNVKLVGKLDAAGNITFPKTTQKLRCGIFVTATVISEATVLTRESKTSWPWWDNIEKYYAPK
jgi:hypothetical protein